MGIGGKKTHFKTCPLCDATCGLKIETLRSEILNIQGDAEDIFSKGYICPKGARLGDLHTDPDRLRGPVKRTGVDSNGAAVFRPISWDAAFLEIETGLQPYLQGNRNSIATYLGNPIVHSAGALLMAGTLIQSLGSINLFTASTLDQMAHHVYAGHMFGDSNLACVPDVDRCNFLLILGANPVVSNGSEWTAPNLPKRLRDLKTRGGQIVVIDPRKTETADIATTHLFIQPGTDALFLASLVNALISEKLVNMGRLAEFSDGYVDLVRWLAPFKPEITEKRTGIAAATLVCIAKDFARAESAAVYGRMGASTSGFGTLTLWLIQLTNILTGNLDREGGVMFPLAATSHPRAEIRGGNGFVTGRYYSRVHNRAEIRNEFPVSDLADEILEPGEGQVHALICHGGNLALSAPDSGRMRKALKNLDFMVAIDPYINETSRYANIILPPPSMLEKAHYDVSFYHLAIRNVANYSAPVFYTNNPQEHEIFAKLALIAQGNPELSVDDVFESTVQQILQGAVSETVEGTAAILQNIDATEPLERLLEASIRLGPYGDQFGMVDQGITFTLLKKAVHGMDFGALKPRLPGALKTANGNLNLAPKVFAPELKRLLTLVMLPENNAWPFRLIGRRQLQSNNSWMHNITKLQKGRHQCNALINPDDASKLSVETGDLLTITSECGELTIAAEITPDIMPGVVSIPHGWGHGQSGTKQKIAAQNPGVNINVLLPRNNIDPLSGTSTLNGIAVAVSKAK